MGNMDNWNSVARPPTSALKAIGAGRLKGKSDINPQWRYKVMTEVYGPYGIGWKFEVVNKWTEAGASEQKMCFADVLLYIGDGKSGWLDPIPGTGGSMLVVKETSGLHTSDEGYKMAVTDALSTAMKIIGVAADIYLGNWDGSKYKTEAPRPEPKAAPQKTTDTGNRGPVNPNAPPQAPTEAQLKAIVATGKKNGMDGDTLKGLVEWYWKFNRHGGRTAEAAKALEFGFAKIKERYESPGRRAWAEAEAIAPAICQAILDGCAVKPSTDEEWGQLAETAKAKIDEGNA